MPNLNPKIIFTIVCFFIISCSLNSFRVLNSASAADNPRPESEMAAGLNDVSSQARSEDEPINAGNKEASLSYLEEAGKFSFKNFDPTVWVLIFLFIFAIAVSIERGRYLYKNRGKNAELVDIITSGLAKNSKDCGGLINIIKDKKYGIEGRVAAKTLEGWPFGRQAMGEFAEAAIGAESRGLDKRLVVLSTLGNNTPFIGLLGTVLGIMKAFRDLAMVGDAGPAVVMKGISEALIATAFGLGVAIPCVIAFNYFSKQTKNRLSNTREIVDMLSGIRSAFETHGAEGVKTLIGDIESEGGNAPSDVPAEPCKPTLVKNTFVDETVS